MSATDQSDGTPPWRDPAWWSDHLAKFVVGALSLIVGAAATAYFANQDSATADAAAPSENNESIGSESSQPENAPRSVPPLASDDPSALQSPPSDHDTGGDAQVSDGRAVDDSITFASNQGVDLDASVVEPLPRVGTPGLDLALDGLEQLSSPEGPNLTRMTEPPTVETCQAAEGGRTSYTDYSQGQWFCFGTSEGARGYFKIADITSIGRDIELTIEYTLRGTDE